MTVDIYGHLIPGANRQAVDHLDDAIGRNPGAARSRRPSRCRNTKPTRFLAIAAISIAIPVVMLTGIVMPNLTRLLDAWPHAGTDAIH